MQLLNKKKKKNFHVQLALGRFKCNFLTKKIFHVQLAMGR